MIYNPVYEYEKWKTLMDDIFGNYYYNKPYMKMYEVANIFENNDGYMIQMNAPGVKQEDLNIEYNNGILVLSVKRENNADDKDVFLRQERPEFDFQRSFSIPENADVNKIEAKLENGMIMIHIGKLAEKKPKKIQVSVK
jgi:HSP20 family protein